MAKEFLWPIFLRGGKEEVTLPVIYFA